MATIREWMNRHREALALVIASLLSNAPLWYFDPGMDVLTHLVSIDCFSEQFWQGNLYPRWCFNANFSYGSLHLLVYYPLSYFADALFYPLHTHFGVSLKTVFVLGVLPPTLLTAFGVRRWLLPVGGGGQATLAAALFLFLPYRMELMFTRCAIGELWCMAIAPFACLWARDLAAGGRRQAWKLGAAFALMLLANVPAALGVMLALGIYALYFTGRKPVLLGWFAFSAVLGFALSSPYWLAAVPYMHLVAHVPETIQVNVNRYVTDVFHGPYPIVLLCSVIMTLVGFALTAFAALRRRSMGAEAKCWLVAGMVLTVSLFPVTAPLWNALNRIMVVGFPWRMQLALCLGIIYLFASAVRLRKGDAVALGGLLLMLPPLFLVQFDAGQRGKIREVLDTHALVTGYYRPVFAAPEYYSWYWYQQQVRKHPYPVEMTDGVCEVKVKQWGWREIALSVDSANGCTLRLHHLYFSLWQLEPGSGASFGPEADTGLMQLVVPGGRKTISIRPLSTPQMMWRAFSVKKEP